MTTWNVHLSDSWLIIWNPSTLKWFSHPHIVHSVTCSRLQYTPILNKIKFGANAVKTAVTAHSDTVSHCLFTHFSSRTIHIMMPTPDWGAYELQWEETWISSSSWQKVNQKHAAQKTCLTHKKQPYCWLIAGHGVHGAGVQGEESVCASQHTPAIKTKCGKCTSNFI